MAHALKRISYATCDPDSCQFSFLAREPKETTNTQYCHAFFTNTPEEVCTSVAVILQVLIIISPTGARIEFHCGECIQNGLLNANTREPEQRSSTFVP
jgi:hypothetical protein